MKQCPNELSFITMGSSEKIGESYRNVLFLRVFLSSLFPDNKIVFKCKCHEIHC